MRADYGLRRGPLRSLRLRLWSFGVSGFGVHWVYGSLWVWASVSLPVFRSSWSKPQA